MSPLKPLDHAGALALLRDLPSTPGSDLLRVAMPVDDSPQLRAHIYMQLEAIGEMGVKRPSDALLALRTTALRVCGAFRSGWLYNLDHQTPDAPSGFLAAFPEDYGQDTFELWGLVGLLTGRPLSEYLEAGVGNCVSYTTLLALMLVLLPGVQRIDLLVRPKRGEVPGHMALEVVMDYALWQQHSAREAYHHIARMDLATATHGGCDIVAPTDDPFDGDTLLLWQRQ